MSSAWTDWSRTRATREPVAVSVNSAVLIVVAVPSNSCDRRAPETAVRIPAAEKSWPDEPDCVIRPRNSTTVAPAGERATPVVEVSAAATAGAPPMPAATPPAMASPAPVRTPRRVGPLASVPDMSVPPVRVGTSASGARPAMQHDAVVGERAVAELPFGGGEVAAEPTDRSAIGGPRGGRLPRAEPELPLAERPREVAGVRAQQLHLEPRFEPEHDLAQMRADRLWEQRQDRVAERPTSSRCGGVRRVVVRDGLQAHAPPGDQPLRAPGEEGTVDRDPLWP